MLQGTGCGLQRVTRHMQVEAGGVQASMAQEQLQTAEIHPIFKQMGGKRVPQQVGTNGYPFNAVQLGYDWRYSKTPGIPVTGGPRL